MAGPLFLAGPAGPVFGRTTGPLEQHSNPTHGLHVLLVGPLFEAVLRHCIHTLILNRNINKYIFHTNELLRFNLSCIWLIKI